MGENFHNIHDLVKVSVRRTGNCLMSLKELTDRVNMEVLHDINDSLLEG